MLSAGVKKVLVLYAHPNPSRSRANRRIVEALSSLPNLTFQSLYEAYPEFYIDVEKEKKLLLEHDVIVFQQPFYWYGMPPLLKLWVDSVLQYNFAHGPEGRALAGKHFLLSLTTGGSRESYSPEGHHHFPISAFFPAYEQTARLCRMHWHEPLVLHQSRSVTEAALIQHAEKVRDKVLELSVPGGDG
jgi:putative NADPH-quinone reductase